MKKGVSNVFAVVALVVVSVVFLGFVAWRMIDKKASEIDYNKYDVNSVIEGTADNGNIADHIKGDPNAPIKIFEYADYQCSGCASAVSRMNKLLEEYAGDVALVYRNFLLSYHQNGKAAASAAEAAGLQGYWQEYGERLFANQSVWSSASGDTRTDMFVDLFRAVTNGAGDEEKFRADMAGEEVKNKINFDAGISKGLEIPGTPSFYLNGERIDFSDAKTEEDFLNIMREKIDAALAEIEKK